MTQTVNEQWLVTVFESGAVLFTHVYDNRGKASACVMRWNRGRKARLERGDVPTYYARMEKVQK